MNDIVETIFIIISSDFLEALSRFMTILPLLDKEDKSSTFLYFMGTSSREVLLIGCDFDPGPTS